ncbi:MAG TPA: alpha-L-arabinofuranosidase C-terminal domain-containing protein, partial [Rhodothermales bacterium]|nr:alpha-L-arabinofuranosidase C-terminal domain-containing protein [Rhodothermales bacterium]
DAGDHMNAISEHIYSKDKPDVLAHVRQLADMIDERAAAHRAYRDSIPGLAAHPVPVAMDEWNYWYGDYIYGELGVRYHLKDALGVAEGLHAFFRNSDVYLMANYAQTVNVIGAIKTTRTASALGATGLALVLYRHHFGSIPVAVHGDTGSLDLSAAWTGDRKALTLAVVNPTPETKRLDLSVQGAALSGKAERWTLSGPDPELYNEPGKPQALVIQHQPVPPGAHTLEIPAYGIAIYRLETE